MAEPLLIEIFRVLDFSIQSAIAFIQQHPGTILRDTYNDLHSQVQQLRQLIPQYLQAEEACKQQFLTELKNKPLTELVEQLEHTPQNMYLTTVLRWLFTNTVM